ncbi:MAG: hypothetical protein A2X37_09445 [Elusimicrobia bacterium GWA2_66_18]|nr:MAG: hypothetical protein A2X37_09445 [Elusimicrobia bacterium GWA2_66_18]
MTLPRRRLVVLLTLAAAVFLAVSQPRRNDERAVLAAVDASAFASLAGRAPADAGELWERLKAMGVGAVLLREETLADLVERGEVLHFTRAEVEKWRVAGLISAGTGLRGDSLWSKDPKALARVLEALAAAGLDASTSTMAGARGLGLPFSVDLARVPAGFDPGAVASLSAAGLLPVAVSTAATVAAAGHRLWVRTLAVDARRGEILRAAYGRPLRLIVFRPRTRSSLDAELDRLRESLRLLRETGLSSILPASSPPPLPSRRGERAARLALIGLLGAAGPLLAVRAALLCSRLARARLDALAPVAAPVPAVLAGLAGSWAVAGAAGAAAAWLAPEGWIDGPARAWTLWTWCAPTAVGAAALFVAGPVSKRRWSAPVRRRDLAVLAGFALAAVLLLAPRVVLRASSLWDGFDRLSVSAGELWWWPWRWRETLVGVPCLAVALILIESDPRGWLLFGLLAPAGMTAALGAGGLPISVALWQSAAAHLLGAAFGAVLAGLRGLLERWVQGPRPHRTIDP